MGNINIAVVEGNLTRAAELSFWSDGTPYCKFTVANNESWKTAEGNYESIPSYIDCLLKGKYAESMSKYLTRGRRPHVHRTGDCGDDSGSSAVRARRGKVARS